MLTRSVGGIRFELRDAPDNKTLKLNVNEPPTSVIYLKVCCYNFDHNAYSLTRFIIVGASFIQGHVQSILSDGRANPQTLSLTARFSMPIDRAVCAAYQPAQSVQSAI